MLAQPAMLLSIPLNNPFPTTLALSAVATAAFGVELAIAKLRVHPRKWMYVLLTCSVVLGVMLIVWSGYFAVYGPASAEPRLHISGIRGPYYVFYATVWYVNIVIALLTLVLVLVTGKLLQKEKG